MMIKKKCPRFIKIKHKIRVGTVQNIGSLISAHKIPHFLFFLTAPILIIITNTEVKSS